MSTIRTRRSLPVLLAAVMVVMTVGVAYAAWTANGSGTGEAQATTAVDLAIEAGTAGTDLYPGATADVLVNIANPNPYPVTLTSVSMGAVTSDMVGCTDAVAADLSFTMTPGYSENIAASGGAVDSLVGTVAMGNNSVDACQGATFTLNLTASGESNA